MTMTVEDVEKLMATFTYKPNFEFQVIRRADRAYDSMSAAYGYEDSCAIGITMWTLNSCQIYPPARQLIGLSAKAMAGIGDVVVDPTGLTVNFAPIKVGRMAPIDRMVLENGEQMFWLWLHMQITNLEHHEVDEWFKVHGECVRDPHKGDRA